MGELTVNLILGDCLERMREIPSGSVDMILCDLPYGTTQNKWDYVIPFEPLWSEYWRVIKRNGAVVLTAQSPFDKVLGCSQIKFLRYEWIWRKESGTGFLNARRAPLKDHENVLVFYRGLPTYNPQAHAGKAYKGRVSSRNLSSANYGETSNKGSEVVSYSGRMPKTVLDFHRDRPSIHPTQKPVALMEYLIRTYTNEGETVLDNCMGSGTTGVACVRTGRNFIGIERDEGYFQIAKERINGELDARRAEHSMD